MAGMFDNLYGRRVRAVVKYNKQDVSAYISPYLKNLTYTDNLSGQADDLQLVLEDKNHLWQQAWLPDRGTTIEAGLLAEYYPTPPAGALNLALGIFEVDQIESGGPPSEVNIKAVSIPYDTDLRGVSHTRSWEKANLKTIAQDVAAGAKLELFWDSEENPVLERAEQSEQSDLSFLLELCNSNGLALKVTGTKIAIFDEAKYESADPVATIISPGTPASAAHGLTITGIINYHLSCKIRDIYAACTVNYQQNKKKAKITGTFKLEGKTGRTLFINEQVETVAAAEKLAKKRLREKNKEETTASFTVPGTLVLAAGSTVILSGYGQFDGKYLITKATHQLAPFVTSVELRRCLDGY